MINEVISIIKQAPVLLLIKGANGNKPCTVGFYFSAPVLEPFQNEDEYQRRYNIPRTADSFLFYYEDNFCMHFTFPEATGANIGYFNQTTDYPEGGMGIQYNYSERIYISYTSGTQTYVDINLGDMVPIDKDKSNFPTEIPL